MSVSLGGGRLRRLHSKTKASKHGLSQFITGRSASFQSLQLVFEGELGDSTSVLSKEWQALAPRRNSSPSAASCVHTVHSACLDSLLDGIAELSTSTADGGGSSDGNSSVRGGRSFGGSMECSGPGNSPTAASSQHTSSLQVVPVMRCAEHSPPFARSAPSYDTGMNSFGWEVLATRTDSMDSCGSRAKMQ